jgi:hypothetical protein
MATFNRLLLYANDIDIVGLVYSSSVWHWAGTDGVTSHTRDYFDSKNMNGWTGNNNTSFRWLGQTAMQVQIEGYRQSYDNLIKHDPAYPHPDYLRDMVFIGNIAIEGDMRGTTPGSDLIKYTLLDEVDDSPVWLAAWGGTNTIAMALKDIEDEYKNTPEWNEIYQRVVDKARIYIILDQDRSYPFYIMQKWPDIQVINNRNQFWSFAYQWSSRVPTQYRTYFQAPWNEENIIGLNSPLLNHYFFTSDGFNLTLNRWAGHRQYPMGWTPRFVGSNSGTTQNIDAPWPKGANLHHFTDPDDPRWAEWGEHSENRGNPTGSSRNTFISEGDSPSFFHLLDVGLRSDENPTYGGWGGRFEYSPFHSAGAFSSPTYGNVTTSTPTPGLWSDVVRATAGGSTRSVADTFADVNGVSAPSGQTASFPQTRWAPALQNDWAARSAWTVVSPAEANYAPKVEILNGLDRDGYPGETITMQGFATDPNGDALTYKWWQYREAGTYSGAVSISADGASASFTVPDNARIGDTIHVILEVTDVNRIPLTRYQRVIVNVVEAPIPITSIRINAVAIENIKRGEVKQFRVTLNEGASDEGIVWTTANPALATVNADGVVTVKNIIGTVVLTATDPVSRRSHSVLLRIAS